MLSSLNLIVCITNTTIIGHRLFALFDVVLISYHKIRFLVFTVQLHGLFVITFDYFEKLQFWKACVSSAQIFYCSFYIPKNIADETHIHTHTTLLLFKLKNLLGQMKREFTRFLLKIPSTDSKTNGHFTKVRSLNTNWIITFIFHSQKLSGKKILFIEIHCRPNTCELIYHENESGTLLITEQWTFKIGK